MVGVNLISGAVQLGRTRRRHLKRWAVSILAAVVVLTVPLAMDWYQGAQAAELRAQNGETQIRLATTRNELRALATQASESLLQLERARALRSKRAWSAMLGLIAKCMPSECWLTSIATDPAVPRQLSARTVTRGSRKPGQDAQEVVMIEAPRKLRLAGYVADASQTHEFVTRLKDTDVFTHVVLESSRREPVLDGYYFRFDLLCEW